MRMSLLQTNLFTRLLTLMLVSTAPSILVLVYLQSEIRAQERANLTEDALRQAELVDADLDSIVEGARQMTAAVSRIDSVRTLDASCSARMSELRGAFSNYDTLAIMAEDGTLICASGLSGPDPALQDQMASVLHSGAFETGDYTPAGHGHDPILPFFQPFTAADGSRHGVVVAGLSLHWLAEHMMDFKRPTDSTVELCDRRGTILLHLPDNDNFLGKAMPAGTNALIHAPQRGNAVITGIDGMERLVGYVPITEAPTALFASVGLYLPALSRDIDRAAWRGYALMACSALLSLWLAMLLAERFVRRPTASLLEAARSWSAGDLAARVDPGHHMRSEFSSLATAFNSMAAALGHQRAELEELNATLEARVAARTADLRASRDRLQVAMAEHAKSEASLRQSQKLHVVGQLAGGIAHDFNNLLTGILGALDVLRRRIPESDARSRRLLDTALMAADRGGKLTAQLLTFSRRQRLVPEPTDLNTVLPGMLDLMLSTLGRNVKIETELDDRLWRALVDPTQVESAILNLAINARDAMPQGGTLRITTANVVRAGGLTLMQRSRPPTGTRPVFPFAGAYRDADRDAIVVSERVPDGDYVLISVSDSGEGMSPDVLTRVFEPFFTTKEPGKGSGLGLSQVHGLVAQSGGEVQIESREQQGTTVHLLLPRAMAPDDEPHVMPRGTRTGGLTVLVVDDNEDVRRMTGEMLAELGYRPILAEDGEAALATLLELGWVDVLLADYAMPGLSGPDLIEAVQRRHPDLRAVLMTGVADRDMPGLSWCRFVLRKPFTVAALARVLREANTRVAASAGSV